MKMFAEIKIHPHDASGIDDPNNYMWETENGIYYPKVRIKGWYKLGDAEYSTDPTFFKEHQVAYCKSQRGITIYSRIELRNFMYPLIQPDWKDLIDVKVSELITEIHNKLLSGGYGKGEFID